MSDQLAWPEGTKSGTRLPSESGEEEPKFHEGMNLCLDVLPLSCGFAEMLKGEIPYSPEASEA